MEFEVKTEENSYNIEAYVKEIGQDLLVALWGGERPHIGAVAMAQPRPSLRDSNLTSSTASVFCYPGHKDDIVAKEAALKISSALNRNVTVTAGIHWDNIDEAAISRVIGNSRRLITMIIERIAAEKDKP